MALVHESVSDFVLFPRDQACYDSSGSLFDENLVGLDCDIRSPPTMQQIFPDRGAASFGDSPNTLPYQCYGVPNTLEPKQVIRQPPTRYTSSGSASPSIPQFYDNPPSTLSSTSGASGQSTASSTVGSPYSLATHSLPGQDTWSESNQGLGIAPDVVHNDAFAHGAFFGSSIGSELCYQDAKYSDSFVGEYEKFSSITTRSEICSPSATSRVLKRNYPPFQSFHPQPQLSCTGYSATYGRTYEGLSPSSVVRFGSKHHADPSTRYQFIPFGASTPEEHFWTAANLQI
ncbi:MAG: hypothetical protein LQ341_004451 [Variospora aurantia]|nr:MAG: hypothetical protein LQ341_004451 [Variospora aurantia]